LLLLLRRVRPFVPVLVLAAIAVAFYLAAGRFLDLAQTIERLERLDAGLAAVGLVCAIVLYLLKAIRWRWYAAATGHVLTWPLALSIYLAGQWFALARSADISRVVMAWRYGIPYPVAIAIGAAAGVADFCGLTWAGLAATPWHPEYVLVILAVTAGATALVWALGGGGPLGRMVEEELPERYAGAVQSGRRLLRGRPLAVGLAISVLDALAGAGVMLMAGLALGLGDLGLPRAMLVYALSQIAGGLSMIPLGLGVVEGSGVLLLVAAGVDASLATAVLVLYRLLTLSGNMLVGGVGLAVLRLHKPPRRGAPDDERPTLERIG
jgi:uncharacterized membrane protein YbhN (UPF0104 family)